MARKPSMGRQKIEIKRINCEASRQVTFSKRRAGLFKKASELCTLCGAETAIFVFSPAGKVFSFGHPTVESIVERFLAKNDPRPEVVALPLLNAYCGTNLYELNRQYSEALNQLETEKKRAEALHKSSIEAKKGEPWCEAPIEDMGLLQLRQLKMSMEELKKKMVKRADELVANESKVTSPFLAINSMRAVDRFAAARDTPYPNNASLMTPYGHGYGFSLGRGLF
ncbi:agamous-like MADS-box protein AGL61 [Macadamia integrifolia]|uniref:agamous-like MADS-box protein AGL61 n=1 Tax=Macadamia integrifolia TaxID=60698 RepID=UPI001C4ECAB0|nr:agamous-like MADS-box protein AGL61 [Macadamia integrifolia]XP_042487353.1 agamous-like MADS-box protein AGL61 [Macadamia integrifolia]